MSPITSHVGKRTLKAYWNSPKGIYEAFELKSNGRKYLGKLTASKNPAAVKGLLTKLVTTSKG